MSQSGAGSSYRTNSVLWLSRFDQVTIGCGRSGSYTERWLVRTLLFSSAISTAFTLSRPDLLKNSARERI